MAGPNWYVSNGGRVEGPFKAEDLATNRLLVPSSYVWHDGLDGWQAAGESELASLLVNDDLTPAGRPSWEAIDPAVDAPPTPSPWSIAAMSAGVLAVLFFPIVLGPLGMFLAGVGFRRQEPRAALGMGIAIGGMILGFLLAFFAVSQGVGSVEDLENAFGAVQLAAVSTSIP